MKYIKHIKRINIKLMVLGLVFAGVVASVIGTQTQALECSVLPETICSSAGSGETIEETAIWAILLLVINILTAGVALTAVGGIVYGAVLYTTAGGSQEQVKKAKTIFVNVVIGVFAFALMYSLLQWLIPGGVF